MKDICTKIYAANVTELKNQSLYSAAYHKVTDERRKKTDRLSLTKDRQLSLGAELLLLYGLEQQGIKLREMTYKYGENGKPYLTGNQEVYFNLSHSEEVVICAISPQEIGCDVEKLHEINLNVARRFFCKGEYDMINAEKSEEKRREMFFRLWTLKESFIKLTGMGMSMPMNSFEIKFNADGISVKQELNNKTYYFQEINFLEDYKCSVCGTAYELGARECVPLKLIKLSNILTK